MFDVGSISDAVKWEYLIMRVLPRILGRLGVSVDSDDIRIDVRVDSLRFDALVVSGDSVYIVECKRTLREILRFFDVLRSTLGRIRGFLGDRKINIIIIVYGGKINSLLLDALREELRDAPSGMRVLIYDLITDSIYIISGS